MIHGILTKSIFSSDLEFTFANKVMILCGFLLLFCFKETWVSLCPWPPGLTRSIIFSSTTLINGASGSVICYVFDFVFTCTKLSVQSLLIFLLWILWFALWFYLSVALSAFCCLMAPVTGFGPAVILNGLISRSLITSAWIYPHFGPKRSLSR